MKIKNKNNAASSTKLNDPKNFRYNNSPLPTTTKLQLQHHHHLLLFAFLSIIIIFFFINFSIFTKLTKMSIAPKTINQTFYISHGSPMLSIDDSLPARHFLKSWGDKFLDQKPNSILVISGHWETHEPTVTAVDRCDTIYDFYGFPAPMYKIKYPVPGAPDLAKRVQELLSASGFKRVHINKKRGLDHGAWVPLMLMYPEADIPVCQLSIQMNKDAAYHYNMGQALASLKEEGVLIIGSGSATHNLRDLNPNAGQEVVPWAAEFDKWLEEALISGRYDDVNNYLNKAPHARKAHPSPDHFYPLHVALGAAGESAKAELLHRSWELGTLSYASYKFTSLD